jgi:hypothetical protein
MKNRILYLLATLAGFLGGMLASTVTRPVIAQDGAQAQTHFFVNGQEVLPKDGKIEFESSSAYRPENYSLSVHGYDGVISFDLEPPAPIAK